MTGPEGVIEQRLGCLGVEGGDARGGDPRGPRLGDGAGHTGDGGPQTPLVRLDSRHRVTCHARDGVQHRVGGRVTALTGSPKDTGNGRDEDDALRRVPTARRDEVGRPVDLHPQHRCKALGRELFDDPIVQDTGGVHDPLDGPQRLEDGIDGSRLGDVTGKHVNPHASLGEFIAELGQNRVRRATPGE